LLTLSDVNVSYGKVPVLRQIHLAAEMGKIVSIIGANGAGKTTLLRTISSLVRPSQGTIEFDGISLALASFWCRRGESSSGL
jgi:branched-chain amino acid transport system ATP-binding protein